MEGDGHALETVAGLVTRVEQVAAEDDGVGPMRASDDVP
jgi:hypothetical protein